MNARTRLSTPTALLLCALLLLTAGGSLAEGAAEPLPGEQIWARCAGAVVYLRNLDAAGTLRTAGSGFFISADGLLLTAAHVVRNASELRAVLDGTELTGAKVLYYSAEYDVAVLRLPQRAEPYPFLTLAEETPYYAERLYAVGYPLRTTKIVVDGVVSAPTADINGVARLLLSADLASGMSGGPVIGQYGAVVGLNSGVLRTMNGISVSPTTAQLRDAVASVLKEAK